MPAAGYILQAFHQLVGSDLCFVRLQANLPRSALQIGRNIVRVIDSMADEQGRSTAFLRLPDEVEDFL